MSTDWSDMDFEVNEDKEEPIISRQRSKKGIKFGEAQFQHLLEFSEVILPTALYEPMKWCHISIRDSLKHVAKTEEIVHNMKGSDTLRLQVQLEAWKKLHQTCTSKSRLVYSVPLYQHAGDILYFAFYQNRGIAPEIRERLDTAFLAQFGSRRLQLTRSLVRLYWKHYSQIEDFLSILPQIYRSEVLAGLISQYLNPLRTDKKGVVQQKINQLLSSPDYHENQISLMLLTGESCEFKEMVLSGMIKYMITDPLESAPSTTPPPTTSTSLTLITNSYDNCSSTSGAEDLIRSRLKLFLEAEPDLLVNACLATQKFPTTLFDIIANGLDRISLKITRNRSKVFPDFRPPLFGGVDPAYSLPIQVLRFFQKIKVTPSETSLLARLKQALRKYRGNSANTEFWIELFALLNDRNLGADGNKHFYPFSRWQSLWFVLIVKQEKSLKKKAYYFYRFFLGHALHVWFVVTWAV